MRRQQRQLRGQPLLAELTSRSYPALPISSISSGRYETYTGSPAPCAEVADVHHQCRSWPPGTQPRLVVLADGDLEHARVVGRVDPLVRPSHGKLPADVRLGLQGSRPSLIARMCNEQPAPPAKPGRFWKMHEPW